MTDHQLGTIDANLGGAYTSPSCLQALGRLAPETPVRMLNGAGHKSEVSQSAMRYTLPIYLCDIIKISIADERSVPAEVVWTSGDNCGLRFNDPFDGALMLAEILNRAQGGRLSRAKGAEQELAATDSVQRAARLRRLETRDYSDTAGGIEVNATLESGQTRRGILRWVQGEMAYIQLLG